MGDTNINASASAEANGLKISGNTVEFNIGSRTDNRIGKVLRALNPSWYEQREAAAREIKAASMKKTIDTIMEGCPAMTRQRALMWAMGYPMTNEQADNFVSVACGASDILEESGKATHPLLPEMRDCIVSGSSGAYEDQARILWGKILAGEINNPGSFSKQTLSILSVMNKQDIETFAAFSSLCVLYLGEGLSLSNTVPIMYQEGDETTYNDGKFTHKQLMQLESLGLISRISGKNLPQKSGMKYRFYMLENVVTVECKSDSGYPIIFLPALTKCGMELSSLCETGTMDGLHDYFTKFMMKQGSFGFSWQSFERPLEK